MCLAAQNTFSTIDNVFSTYFLGWCWAGIYKKLTSQIFIQPNVDGTEPFILVWRQRCLFFLCNFTVLNITNLLILFFIEGSELKYMFWVCFIKVYSPPTGKPIKWRVIHKHFWVCEWCNHSDSEWEMGDPSSNSSLVRYNHLHENTLGKVLIHLLLTAMD